MNELPSPHTVMSRFEEGVLPEDEAIGLLQETILRAMDVETIHAPSLLAQLACQSETSSQKVWVWVTGQLSRVRYGEVPYMAAELIYHLLYNTLVVHRKALPDLFERYRRGEPAVLQMVTLYGVTRMVQLQSHGWKTGRKLFTEVAPQSLPETQAITDLVRRYIARRTLKQGRADLAVKTPPGWMA